MLKDIEEFFYHIGVNERSKEDIYIIYVISNLYSFLHFGRFIIDHGSSFSKDSDFKEVMFNLHDPVKIDLKDIEAEISKSSENGYYSSKSDRESISWALDNFLENKATDLYLDYFRANKGLKGFLLSLNIEDKKEFLKIKKDFNLKVFIDHFIKGI